ncbi:MAG: HEAT repeat domain-containing protein [Gammaproteobacteria bacterium]|nr:HEAT repeat domain-containing protein [Gammaproteobacteria bacterium]
MSHVPDVVLLITGQCPHCASVMKSLSELLKQGEIATLEMVNIEHRPERAAELGVRAVPWMKVGWFELTGLHSQGELLEKARQAGSDEGARAYISEELKAGRVNTVVALVAKQHELISHVLALLEDAEAGINVRLGVGVILEEHAPADWFAPYIQALGEYTRHEDERVRADACHYLSLTQNKAAVPFIKSLQKDDSELVREVAEESLEALRELGVPVE